MPTLGEEIDAWIKKFEESDNEHRYWMLQIAAAEYFKAEKIWEYVKDKKIPKPDYLK